MPGNCSTRRAGFPGVASARCCAWLGRRAAGPAVRLARLRGHGRRPVTGTTRAGPRNRPAPRADAGLRRGRHAGPVRAAPGSFDLVYQPVSSLYVPDIRQCYRQVAAVTRPGGLFFSEHWNPVQMQLAEGRSASRRAGPPRRQGSGRARSTRTWPAPAAHPRSGCRGSPRGATPSSWPGPPPAGTRGHARTPRRGTARRTARADPATPGAHTATRRRCPVPPQDPHSTRSAPVTAARPPPGGGGLAVVWLTGC